MGKQDLGIDGSAQGASPLNAGKVLGFPIGEEAGSLLRIFRNREEAENRERATEHFPAEAVHYKLVPYPMAEVAPALYEALREMVAVFWGDAREQDKESLRKAYPDHKIIRAEAALALVSSPSPQEGGANAE